jgi:DNA-directed RNA polymerase subunit M/transcription elongation factor TFIIS
MDNLGPAGEFLRISEHYRRLADDELLTLAQQSSELTEMAQQALANEMAHRRLKLEPEEAPPPKPEPPKPVIFPAGTEPDTAAEAGDSWEDSHNDPYEEDRALIVLCTVWSLADALQVQSLLDAASIPFFMGEEKATNTAAVTSDFTKGVTVHIMRIGIPWARQAMQHYVPVNDQSPKDEAEEPHDEILVCCPKCHSAEVVLEETIAPTDEQSLPQRFEWTCDSCGNRWEDDGVLKKE